MYRFAVYNILQYGIFAVRNVSQFCDLKANQKF